MNPSEIVDALIEGRQDVGLNSENILQVLTEAIARLRAVRTQTKVEE